MIQSGPGGATQWHGSPVKEWWADSHSSLFCDKFTFYFFKMLSEITCCHNRSTRPLVRGRCCWSPPPGGLPPPSPPSRPDPPSHLQWGQGCQRGRRQNQVAAPLHHNWLGCLHLGSSFPVSHPVSSKVRWWGWRFQHPPPPPQHQPRPRPHFHHRPPPLHPPPTPSALAWKSRWSCSGILFRMVM